MSHELPELILQKYPQLKEISAAIEQYKKNGEMLIRCKNCNELIVVKENQGEGVLETNCACDKSKYRIRWEPNLV